MALYYLFSSLFLETQSMLIMSSSIVSESFDNDDVYTTSQLSSTSQSFSTSEGTNSHRLEVLSGSPACYKYSTETDTDFMAWWTTTIWYHQNQEKDLSSNSRYAIYWGTGNKRASAWEYFSECAVKSSGEPKVFCNRCNAVQKHPGLNIGTNTMTDHLKTGKCYKKSKFKGLETLTLGPGFRAQVRL